MISHNLTAAYLSPFWYLRCWAICSPHILSKRISMQMTLSRPYLRMKLRSTMESRRQTGDSAVITPEKSEPGQQLPASVFGDTNFQLRIKQR